MRRGSGREHGKDDRDDNRITPSAPYPSWGYGGIQERRAGREGGSKGE